MAEKKRNTHLKATGVMDALIALGVNQSDTRRTIWQTPIIDA